MGMNLTGAIAAIKAFTEAVNGNVVPSDEIFRRTDICAKCPMKRKVTGAPSKVSRYLGVLANKHRVPADLNGQKCNVCGCSLMLLIPATEADLHKDSPEEAEKRPASCWMKKLDISVVES
jgi:hypothetical protein